MKVTWPCSAPTPLKLKMVSQMRHSTNFASLSLKPHLTQSSWQRMGAVPLRFSACTLQLLPFLMRLLYLPIWDLAAVPEMQGQPLQRWWYNAAFILRISPNHPTSSGNDSKPHLHQKNALPVQPYAWSHQINRYSWWHTLHLTTGKVRHHWPWTTPHIVLFWSSRYRTRLVDRRFWPFQASEQGCLALILFNYNLSPEERFCKKHIISLGSIPKKPLDLDSFLWPVV